MNAFVEKVHIELKYQKERTFLKAKLNKSDRRAYMALISEKWLDVNIAIPCLQYCVLLS